MPNTFAHSIMRQCSRTKYCIR